MSDNGNQADVHLSRGIEDGSYNIRLSVAEFDELIALIDDGEVDEEFLQIIRRRLVKKRRQARRRLGGITEGTTF